MGPLGAQIPIGRRGEGQANVIQKRAAGVSTADTYRIPPRYRRDGKTAAPLSPVQDKFRDQILAKLAANTYHLEVITTCLCGGQESVAVSEKDRFGIPVGVVTCRACGLLRTSPRLAAADLPAFYDHEYHGLHMGIPDPAPTTNLFRVGQGTRIYAFARPHLPEGTHRIAEVGCGTGEVLREFAQAAAADGRVTSLVGCEFATKYVLAGRQGGPEVLLEAGPADVIVLSHVLEHFADVPNELSLIRRMAHEATVVYVEVPGLFTVHLKPDYGYDLLQYLTLAHTYHFSRDTLRDTMRRAGFSMVAGDEHVHSLFRVDPHRAGSLDDDASGRFDQLIEYVNRLERSPRLRLQRVIARAERRGLKVGELIMRFILSDSQYAALRARARGRRRA